MFFDRTPYARHGAERFRPINRPGGRTDSRTQDKSDDGVGELCGGREDESGNHVPKDAPGLFIAAIFMWIDYFSDRPEIARVRHARAYYIASVSRPG